MLRQNLSIDEKMKLHAKRLKLTAICKDNITYYNDMLPCANHEYWEAKIKIEYAKITDLNAIKI